jgi:hypothetical protein
MEMHLNRQSVRLRFVAELRLQVGELRFQDLNAHQHDVFRFQRASWLDVEEEFVRLCFPVVFSFDCGREKLVGGWGKW